jgi:tetratricopeptide (TPR) repeat protein
MRRWLILVGCALAIVPALADEDAPADSTTTSAVAPDASTDVMNDLLPVHLHADGAIRDNLGTVAVPKTDDVPEEEPLCFKEVDYLNKHNDPVQCANYLRKIVNSNNVLPQDRARAILELGDVLGANHQEPEALGWLKLWTELFPARPEYGAVAYRIGSLYSRMGLTSLARDAYYLALAHTVNQAQMKAGDDLKYYARLTNATLWGLAANEYQNGQWERGADLFQRYRNEASGASATSLEKAAFLQADCYYQLKQSDKAVGLYEETLTKHPFNPLAPQARLRLYHLYVTKNDFPKAKDDLEALAWTVRTVWPKDEVYWQRQTAQLLLALNKKNAEILPPLVQKSAQLPPEGKTWQDAISHYDALVSFQASAARKIMDKPTASSKTSDQIGLSEENDLAALSHNLNQVLPPASTP